MFKQIKKPEIGRSHLFALAAYVMLFRVIYVFWLTDYPNYLFSDMEGYWVRAIERFNGNETGVNQWAIWPPFFHIALSGIFEIIHWIGLDFWRLEIILFLNCALGAISTPWFYKLCRAFGFSRSWGFASAIFYGCFFPFVYFNAFVLSENLAIPLVVISMAKLFDRSSSSRIAAGALLGIAVIARPAFALFALPYWVYLVLNRKDKSWLTVSVSFILPLFMVVGAMMIENIRISGGHVTGLSANAGINAYLSMTGIHRLDTKFDGFHYVLIPPGTVDQPERGHVEFEIPTYDQKAWFGLALAAAREKPYLLVEKLGVLKKAFKPVLFPSMPSALGFEVGYQSTRWLLIGLFALLVFSVLLPAMPRAQRNAGYFGVSIVALSFLTYTVFNAELRYTFSLGLILIPLGGLMVMTLVGSSKTVQRVSMLVGLPVICGILYLVISPYHSGDKNLRLQLIQNREPVNHLWQAQVIEHQWRFSIDTVDFSESAKGLRHVSGVDYPFEENFFAMISGDIEVLQAGSYTFVMCSDDGFAFHLDKNLVSIQEQPRAYGCNHDQIPLDAGRYGFSITYFQARGDRKLRAFYRFNDGPLQRMGESGPVLDFLKPTEGTASQ